MPSPRLARRWGWVVVPMVGVLALEGLQDTALEAVLPMPIHVALLSLVLLGGAVVVAGGTFRRFDRMTAELAARTAQLEARDKANAALQRVGLVVSAQRDLDRVLDTVAEQARLLLGGEIALVCLAGDDGRLAPRSHSGPIDAFHAGPDRCPHPDGGGGACPILTAELRPEDARDGGATDAGGSVATPLCRLVDPAYLGSPVAVPLTVGERVLGTLVVSTRERRRFGALELSTLESLASLAAVAIDNARLNRRVRELGMVEERNRLARELHDGVAQVLGYVGTKSDAALALLEAGRHEDARRQLDELAAAARSVYVDVREAILGLSTPIELGGGVVPAVREYARRYAETSKLPTEVRASPEAEAVRLAPAAEAQALRILQEALTNVRKHAGARRVVVDLACEDRTLAIEVRDDGAGFDPAAGPPSDWRGFGLGAMRERAASVAGQVEIDSRPGAGTSVRLRLPIALDA